MRRPGRRRTARAPSRDARGIGVGVVSRNVVDAAIELASETGAAVMLIASRNQVDSAEFGGGYVEGWTTEEFTRYVRAADRGHRVLLCRDHGGPWQHASERNARLSERAALDSALASFKTDLDSGFDLLHVDTSVECGGHPDHAAALGRLRLLYASAHEIACSRGRPVSFEIGCESQVTEIQTRGELEESTCRCLDALERDGLPRPRYVVLQTGTKVVETSNVGDISVAADAADTCLIPLVDACHGRGVAVKAHNCDYLPLAAWQALSRARVDAVNVAPEYGVVETRAVLEILARFGHVADHARFLQLAYDSGKWSKWMAANTEASDDERAVIAGHYVFSTHEFRAIRDRLGRHYPDGVAGLDRELRDAIKRRIVRHVAAFGLA